jgi:PhzF family phenazine biosynthesis protein
MKLHFTTLDVFTSTRYQGNPLAIIQVPAAQKDALSQTQKQSIAKEFNLSETVFMHESSTDEVHIDIFTSFIQIPFAGHPTIGSAFYLLSLQQKPIKALITGAGRIPVTLDSASGFLLAEIPHDVHIHALTTPSPLNSASNPCVSIVNGMSFFYVLLPNLEALGKATSNLNGDTYDVQRLDEGWRNGLTGTMYYVDMGTTADGTKEYRTRMWGSREDPATGSASSGLGAYLALQEDAAKGNGPFKYKLTQGVEMGKKSEIGVEVSKDGNKIVRIGLSGTAVKVMEGTLEI